MPYRTEHGSAKWADHIELDEGGFLDNNGLPLGYFRQKGYKSGIYALIGYRGDQHMLTVAPTRSGKGVSAIIPALLEYGGGVLCIDPKGENAIITAEARERDLGQKVAIIDPWSLACKVLDREPDQFNPLDMLSADSDDLADDAMMIADALVLPSHSDSFWVDEARAMIMGFILYLVISPNEEGRRTLGRLREILSLSPTDFMTVVNSMADMKDTPLVRNAGNRIKQKSDRELASVISTAQQNTHFIESPKVQKSLKKTTFDFGDLKDDDNPITVYLVLPADRLNTHGRWLRLIVSMAITATVRRAGKPKKSALFILDEFAALGKLAVVEQAYGLMAGFGMVIWAILQDLSQLQDLYQKRWQTFVANAGVLQAFGTRDTFTAEYLSKLCGKETAERISEATSNTREGGFFTSGDPNYTSMNDQIFGRALMMPEEIMRLRPFMQLLFLPQSNPLMCLKIPYYENGRYYYQTPNGNPAKFRVHPNFEGQELRFSNYDLETQETIEREQAAAAKKAAAERAEQARKEREEIARKAAETGKEVLKKAGKFAKFMGEKLKEGQSKFNENQGKKDDE